METESLSLSLPESEVPVLDETCPLASDVPSEAFTEQPVSQSSESIYEEAPTVRHGDEDDDNGCISKLAKYVFKEDREKDALWEEVDEAAIKDEWESANRKRWRPL
jgi:hypothetical protein